MTQDNSDKPQPEKAKPKAVAKTRATPPSPDATPAATAKPRLRQAAAPRAAKPKTTAPEADAPKPTSSKPAALKTSGPKTRAPKAGEPSSNEAKPGVLKAASRKAATPRASAEPAAARQAVLDCAAAPESTAPAKVPIAAVARAKAIVKPEPANREIPAPAGSPQVAPGIAAQVQVAPLSVAPAVAEHPLGVEAAPSHSSPPRGGVGASSNKSAWQRALGYWQLMRMHKPIGTLLLLWPTLWALWLAAEGIPRWDLLIIFVLGVVVMRSAGCVINDFADRNIDGQVKRTKDRPLVNGRVSGGEAIGLFLLLCLLGFGLVLLTNRLTIQLSVGGLLLAFCYPFMKRYTHLPQVVLGAAFAWSIPMAFAAQSGNLGGEVWLVYTTVVLWTVVYDTFYAMVDRDDDRRIGVKSTAILFGEQDRMITGVLQALTLYGLAMIGSRFELGVYYYAGLMVTAVLFAYQQYLIRLRERDACFKAFLNNNWVGAAVFAGIVFDFLLSPSL